MMGYIIFVCKLVVSTGYIYVNIGKFTQRSKNPVSHLLKLLLNLLRISFQMSADLDLFLVGQFGKYLTKLPIDHGLAWRVVRTISERFSACKTRDEVPHVHLKMQEKVDIFSCFKGTKCTYGTIDCRIKNKIGAGSGETSFLDGGHDLSDIKSTDLFHFEWRSVQIAIFPPKLVRVRIVLKVLFRI